MQEEFNYNIKLEIVWRTKHIHYICINH